MPDRDLIAEGREKLAAAAPGPFQIASREGIFTDIHSLHRLLSGKDGYREVVARGVRIPDAELFVYVLNRFGRLLDELEQARARIAELERDLRAEGNRGGRLEDLLRTACADASATRFQLEEANARIAELERENIRLSGVEQVQPLGYIVLAKRPRLGQSEKFRFSTAGDPWEDLEPVENHRYYCEDQAASNPRWYRGVEYVIAELREVTDR